MVNDYLWWQQLRHKSQRGEMERNFKDDDSSTEGQLGDKPKWTILDSRHVETEVHA